MFRRFDADFRKLGDGDLISVHTTKVSSPTEASEILERTLLDQTRRGAEVGDFLIFVDNFCFREIDVKHVTAPRTSGKIRIIHNFDGLQ